MTDAEIISNIKDFTTKQIAEFNKVCNGKIYNEQTGHILLADKIEATDTAAAVNLLTQAQIDANISPNLNSNRKLSGRPC